MSDVTTGAGGTKMDLQFRPRARILQLLGDELIGSPRLAVFELVKNAYNANAETVRVVLNDIESDNASIVVADDGDGMTLETIRDIWLVPGHDHRARQRKALQRTRLNRLPLGEKRVGGFAAHKLGNRIELITRAEAKPECVVSINWADLIRQPHLSDAIVRVVARNPVVFRGENTGTRITISELRERKWTRGEVRRLQRQITSIVLPFTSRSDHFEARLEAPGLEDWVTGVPDVDVLLKRAPWWFRFIFINGRFDWEYSFEGHKPVHKGLVRFDLALPGDEAPPSVASETLLVPPVPVDVAGELGLPELLARPGCICHSATVPVPETAVDENHDASFREDDVRAAREAAAVRPKPVAEGVERSANEQFRLGIDTANAAHEGASVLPRQDVGHSQHSCATPDAVAV